MIKFKVQEENEIKSFILNRDDPNKYQNEKLEIEKYLESLNQEIIENYKEFELKVVTPKKNGIPKYWCGYISYCDKEKLKDIYYNNKIYCGWTFNSNNTIGFDCAHLKDISIHFGINSLDTFDDEYLKNRTYKSPHWVLKQLKTGLNHEIEK
jgi:hypothetical protein